MNFRDFFKHGGQGGPGRGTEGSAAADVTVAAAILVFILLPVFSAVAEKYIIHIKSQIIRDAVDVTNISAYNALNAAELGKVRVRMPRAGIAGIFNSMLAKNLGLDENLNPGPGSVAEGQVEVMSLEIYESGFPATCPNGAAIYRPTVHSVVRIPVRSSLYRGIILDLMGKEHIDIMVHVDSEIPVDN